MRNVNIWTPFQTIIIKEFRRFIRIWGQTVVPPAVTMALYFIIFGQLFKMFIQMPDDLLLGLVDETQAPLVAGDSGGGAGRDCRCARNGVHGKNHRS